ncbi:hypothetical protein GSI_15674 [Ganoderma sinense ZZ0214-1]|uniref:Uncharacterized protein n=1 Tax=Ganoderma sinense ZZ0214-1 TaxID=1077348 RepID=A0A2G8RN89_9APHY|nr:hypothetical protein GSI_15674 [Ganoderma sinense ZZ0214-1]
MVELGSCHTAAEDVDFFMEHGYLVVKQAFSREQAAEFTKDMWTRLGLDPHDQSTWPVDRARIHMPYHKQEPVATFAPRVWEIMKELLGGEDRIDPAASAWGDSFIVNLGPPAPVAPVVAPAQLDNWHVDGDFFVHFLDSPEQALLVIPVFSDIAPGGGATYIAPDGIAPVARYLAAHPEGVLPGAPPLSLCFVPTDSAAKYPGDPRADPGFWSHPDAVREHCTTFVELTADTGDVVLMHPLMPHSASPNVLRVPRVITNPPVALRAPFRFARADDDDDEYSLVERKTLKALGVDRLDFAPTTARRRLVPARVAAQAKMLAEEKRRLEEAEARARVMAPSEAATSSVQTRAIAVA